MKKLITFLLPVFICAPVWGQSIVVSDVDDTIKVTYVLDVNSASANTPNLKNVFIGMPELYHALAGLNKVKAIKYLSNAPKNSIGKLHQRFLVENGFPAGDLVARRNRDLKTGNAHKLNSIRNFIKKYDPTELLLIGDNGEADVEVYATIREEYPELKGLTYIRQAYSSQGFNGHYGKALKQDQIPFATSLDIALDLFKRNELTVEMLTSLISKVAPAILREKDDEERGLAMAFPEWYDCRDYSLPEIPVLTDLEVNELLQQYADKVQLRCGQLPFGD